MNIWAPLRCKPKENTMRFVVLWLAAAHRPDFRETKKTRVGDHTISKVYYSRGGTRSYEWNCKESRLLFWEIYVGNSARPGMTVEAYSHGNTAAELWGNVTGSYTIQPGTTTVADVVPCPFKTFYEGFTAVAYRSILRYGAAKCNPKNVHLLKITSEGPYALAIGEKERFGIDSWGLMTQYYLQAGTWVGLTSPFAHLTVTVIFLVGVNLVSKYAAKRPMEGPIIVIIETLLIAIWVIAFLSDVGRYMMMTHVPRCVPAYDAAAGPDKHNDGSGRGTAAGIFAARLITSASAIALIFVTARATSIGPLIGLLVGGLLIFAACIILGVGYVVAPVSLLGWCIYNVWEARHLMPEAKNVRRIWVYKIHRSGRPPYSRQSQF